MRAGESEIKHLEEHVMNFALFRREQESRRRDFGEGVSIAPANQSYFTWLPQDGLTLGYYNQRVVARDGGPRGRLYPTRVGGSAEREGVLIQLRRNRQEHF